ncbi:DNA polymerase I, partial [Buchnera aphidicola (Hormaphis cornu)]
KSITKNLQKNKKLAFLSLQLVSIQLHLNFNLNSKKLQLSEPNSQILIKKFNFYQFNKWNQQLNQNNWFLSKIQNKTINTPKINKFYEKKVILDKTIFFQWIQKMKTTNIFSFFIETDNIDAYKANILSIAVSIDEENSILLPWKHPKETNQNLINFKEIILYLKPFFENKIQTKIVKNLKLNIILLKKYNIKLLGKVFDVILEKYVLYSYIYQHNIDLSINDPGTLPLCKQKKFSHPKQKTLKNNNSLLIKKSKDLLQLHFKLFKILTKEKKTKHILETIDIPLTKVILNIEENGVLIHKPILQKYSQSIHLKLLKLKKKAYQIAGEPFNLSSNKQSQLILFKKMGLNTFKKTKKGNYSTNESVLLSLSNQHPLPLVILKYRSLAKLKSTYVDKLLKIQNIETGRVYTCYNQISTSTGRLSSIKPNLQNIPIRTKEGRYIRTAFIAPKGYKIVSADYSQIELRIIAHLSKDQVLLHSFKNDNDIHCLTAIDLFNTSLQSITKEQRQIAKTINFSLIYGMSAFGLSEKLNISIKKSQKYIHKYFSLYTGVSEYIYNIRKIAYKNGYIKTLLGRKLHIPNISSNNIYLRKSAERMSVNAPLQGSAADIIKIAMIKIYNYIKQNNINNLLKIIMQVHDELIFEIKTENVKELSIIIKNLMETSVILDLPLKVKIRSGNNWEQAH